MLYGVMLSASLVFWHRNAFSSASPYALGEAVNNEDAQAVEYLLRQGVSPDGTDNPAHYETWGEQFLAGLPFQRYARTGRPVAALAVVNYAARSLNYSVPKMHPAADRAILKMLLEHGADPNISERWQESALLLAVECHNFPACKMLLEYHAHVDAGAPYHSSALDQAAVQGDCDIIRLLLDSGANIEVHHMFGTPLMSAAAFHRADSVRLLLARGANPDARDDMGETPLSLAQSTPDFANNKQQIIDLLKAAGAE